MSGTGSTFAAEVCTCRQMTGGVCPECERRRPPAMKLPTAFVSLAGILPGLEAPEWERTRSRVGRLEAATNEAARLLQDPIARLSARCAKDEPHDHSLLRTLEAVVKLLDEALT